MAYATLDQLNTFGPNQKCWPADFDDQLKSDYLDMASAEIDTYLAVGYQLPLAAPYDLSLVKACVTIASFHLLSKRGWNANAPNDQIFVDNYQRTLDWLNQVARGRYVLNNKKESSANLLNKPAVIY